MAKLKFFLTLVVTFSIFTSLHAQFSREDAIHLILNQILLRDIGNINVYASYDPKSGDDVVKLLYFDPIPCPYSSNWVFFVDDLPFAYWDHPCRYIFVDASNGQYSIITDRHIYPQGLSTEYESVSTIPDYWSCTAYYTQPLPVQYTDTSTNPHLYAVIIIGLDDSIINPGDTAFRANFWNDCSLVYTTLEQVYHYNRSKIFVHYYKGHGARGDNLDGDLQLNDIDYAAYKDTIHHTFRCLAGEITDPKIPELQPDDQLFVYVGDHGGVDGNHSMIELPKDINASNPNDSILRDDTLAVWTKNIKCSQMIFIMQQCNSGGFITYLKDSPSFKCHNRSIYTAVDSTQHAYAEFRISHRAFGEFTFWWATAVRGYFPDIKNYQPWATGFPVYDSKNYSTFPYTNCFPGCSTHPYKNPDFNDDGIITMDEAFTFEKINNAWVDTVFYCLPSGYATGENPQRSKDISFIEDLQSLSGLRGTVINTQTVANRNYALGNPFNVGNSANLTFSPGSKVFYMQPGCIDVEMQSTLNPGTSMAFEGGDDNSVLVEGSIGPLEGVTFRNDTCHQSYENFEGLILDNPDLATVMDSVHFNHAGLYQHHGQSLKISNNANFTNCDHFISYADSINISHFLFQQHICLSQ